MFQSDANSPGHQQQGSPLGVTQLAGGCHDDISTDIPTTVQRTGPIDDPAWPYDAEDLEVIILMKFFFRLLIIYLQIDDLPVVLRAMVGIGADRGGVTVNDRLSRTRLKPRPQVKPLSTIQNMTVLQRKTIGITDLNRRIIDLKVESGSTQLTDLQQRLQSSGNTQVQIRRDSNSTVSSYYGSMRSADMSRKSSLASQVKFG